MYPAIMHQGRKKHKGWEKGVKGRFVRGHPVLGYFSHLVTAPDPCYNLLNETLFIRESAGGREKMRNVLFYAGEVSRIIPC